MDRLREHYQRVRRTYFPRWDRKRRWTVTEKPGLEHNYCRCDTDALKIRMPCIPDEDAELDAVLVHEIAHAVTDQGHGKRWKDRMRKAVARAKAMGAAEVASLVEEDAKNFPASERIRADTFYASISDAVFDGAPSFEAALALAAQAIGLTPLGAERRFTCCRREYNKAVALKQVLSGKART